jgi:cytoplasmic iron level regulating protein YaaA (DUF328/UPF0246 family)
MIGIFAKKARGQMSRYIIKNRISSADDIKEFDQEGYKLNKKLTKGNNFVFTRRQ